MGGKEEKYWVTLCMGCGSVVPENRKHLPCSGCEHTNFSTDKLTDAEKKRQQEWIKNRHKRNRLLEGRER